MKNSRESQSLFPSFHSLLPALAFMAAAAGCAALLAGLASCRNETSPERPSDFVDPFIGTGGHGHTFPGATRPFGMVQLSPDTRLTGWDGCSGYHDTDSIVYGFSHTHLSGTGVPDYGDILLVPTVGEVTLSSGFPDRPGEGYASRFTKSNEHASPGYYRLHLDDYDVGVELTCARRAGFHRYTFPTTGVANVIIDLVHRDRVLDSKLAVVSDAEIEGYRISDSWAREQHMYFVAQFSKPFASYGLARNDSLIEGSSALTGTNIKGFVRFGIESGDALLIKVGISAVSINGARKNLSAEISHWDFDRIRREARQEWDRALGKIAVEGGTDEQRTVFYTALYHTMTAPNLYTDVDGRYRGTDLHVHESDTGDIYTVFSLWDTFRAAHPLYTIIERSRTDDFIRTLLSHYAHGGQLAIWELAGNYTGCMIGYHAIPVIYDAYVKDITDFDAEKALAAMVHSAELDWRGLKAYKARGYISASDEAESVSRTLEYAYDDWCIAGMADALGRSDLYETYLARAQHYKNLFEPTTGFMRARMNGGWIEPFDPAEVNFHFTEANSWQYSFFVPHDIGGLVEIMGGPDTMEDRLDELFTANSTLTGRQQSDITGLIGQYAHGNEPSHHMAYLYNYIGKPWKTQKRVRQIMDDLYRATPDGLAGNEDCGQMSAWYVMSAMGFYPVTPGLPYYTIGSPLFDRVILHLENGRRFEIVAEGASRKNIYIQSALLNGQPYSKSYLDHDTIMAGGTIVFTMGAAPNVSWGSSEGDLPVSAIRAHLELPVPFVSAASKSFTDTLRIAMGVACDTCDIFFTLDGTVPSRQSMRYSGSLMINKSTSIRAVAVAGASKSLPVTADFIKIEGNLHITLHSPYANQYAAGGDNALIDTQRGTVNFRTGSWQGYQGVDFEAVVDLGGLTPITRIAAGFLQDIGSWIWFPTEVEYAVSEDGERFVPVALIHPDVSEDQYGACTRDFSAAVNAKARFIRIRAKNYGSCPDWHPGAGGKAWMFIDEIMVE